MKPFASSLVQSDELLPTDHEEAWRTMTDRPPTERLVDGVQDLLRSSDELTTTLSVRLDMSRMYVDACRDSADARQLERAFVALMDWHSRLRALVHESLLMLKPLEDQRRGLRLVEHEDTDGENGNFPPSS